MGTITQLVAIVGTTEYDLSDWVKYVHVGNDNFGLSPVNRLTEQGPLQHGNTDIGYRLGPRTLQLVLNMLADDSDTSDYWNQRAELLHIFAPRDNPIQLRFTYPLGTRQIACHAVGGLSFPSQDKQAYVGHKVNVSLMANDPTFYDPTLVSESFGIAISSGQMNIPLAIPWNIGSSTLNKTTSIMYAGSFVTYPVITVYGPITDLKITNTTINEKIDFTGSTIAAGKVYTIDCRYGYKTVVDELAVNQIAKLTDDSDLSTFRLETDPVAVDGVNTITVTGTAGTSATQIYFTYYSKYIGV